MKSKKVSHEAKLSFAENVPPAMQLRESVATADDVEGWKVEISRPLNGTAFFFDAKHPTLDDRQFVVGLSEILSIIGERLKGEVPADTTVKNMSKTKSNRKPHNCLAGYVTERKSKHPKLPGHFVILDTQADPSPGIDAGERWAFVYEPAKGCGREPAVVGMTSLANARGLMYAMCGGSNVADFGQHEDPGIRESAEANGFVMPADLDAVLEATRPLEPPAISGRALKELAAKCDEWNARYTAKGGKLATFPCPHCKATQHAPIPPASYGLNEPWDGTKTCSKCGRLYFASVFTDGRVVVDRPATAALAGAKVQTIAVADLTLGK